MAEGKEKNFISVVAYVHDEGAYICEFLAKISQAMADHFDKYEIIFVDDASVDDTVKIIRRSSADEACMVQIVHMSYYHGLEVAMNAGVSLAIGDFVFEFDSTFVDYDFSLVMQIYEKSLQGYDIVGAVPEKDVPASSRIFYYLYNRFSQTQNPLRTERFRILSRRAINRIHSMSTTIPYRKALYANCGLQQTEIAYEPLKIESNNKENAALKDYRMQTALDSLVIFTQFGYKIAVSFSVGMALLCVVLLGYVLAAFFTSYPIEGWTSSMCALSVGLAGIFGVLAMIIKYLDVVIGLVFKKQYYAIQSIEKLT